MVLRTPRGGDRYEKNRRMAQEALEFLEGHVVGHGAVPSPDTLVSVISAAAHLRGVRNGQTCHPFVLRNEFESDLVWFYTRIGAVKDARRLSVGMTEGDVVRWSCLWLHHAPAWCAAFCCNLG
jgi:hypothetical protein